MKKFIIIATLIFISSVVNAQFFQATLKIDGEVSPQRLRVFIKPNGGNISDIVWDRFEFFFRFPRTTNLPVFGDVAVNNVDFPGLSIVKGGLGAAFVNGYDAESGKTNYYFPSSVPNGATNATRTFVNNQEYEVFNVQFTGSIEGIEFIADQVDQFPYYLTLSRVAVPSNMTASGPGAPPGSHVFYGGILNKVGNIFTMSPDASLPVNFLSFYALKDADNAKLSWTVENDMENKQFEVERSTNGRDFTNIQTIAALNNGRNNNIYETVDLGISKHGSSEVFYQIKQIDRDGQSTRSAVRKLSIDGTGKAVSVFPNPMRTTAKVVVDAPEAGRGSIIMRDAVGRQIQLINAQFHKGINNFDLNVATLISGEYNIQVVGPGLSQNVKVSKIQ